MGLRTGRVADVRTVALRGVICRAPSHANRDCHLRTTVRAEICVTGKPLRLFRCVAGSRRE